MTIFSNILYRPRQEVADPMETFITYSDYWQKKRDEENKRNRLLDLYNARPEFVPETPAQTRTMVEPAYYDVGATQAKENFLASLQGGRPTPSQGPLLPQTVSEPQVVDSDIQGRQATTNMLMGGLDRIPDKGQLTPEKVSTSTIPGDPAYWKYPKYKAPQSYGEMVADKQFTEERVARDASILDYALKIGGEKGEQLKSAIADQWEMAPIPVVREMGEYIRMADFRGKNKVAYTVSMLQKMTPEAMQAMGLTPGSFEGLAPDTEIEFERRGKELTPVNITRGTAIKPIMDKPTYVSSDPDAIKAFVAAHNIPESTAAQMDALRKKDVTELEVVQNASGAWSIKPVRGEKKATGKPTSTVASFTPTMLRAKAAEESTPQRVKEALIAQASEIETRKPNERKEMMQLDYDVDGLLIGAKPVFQPAPQKIDVKVGGVGGAGGAGGYTFDEWDFQRYYDTGKLPEHIARFAGKAGAEQRIKWDTEFKRWAKEKEMSGAGVQTSVAGFEADKKSLAGQQKNYDLMKSFIKNVDSQVKRVKELTTRIPQADLPRFLNMPYNEAIRAFLGDAELAKYRMYIANIETEISKVASGATGSVREPSVALQAKYAKIHDKNMPVSEMLKLVDETVYDGKLRLQSVEDQLKETRSRMGKVKEDSGGDTKAITDRVAAQAKELFPNNEDRQTKWMIAKLKNDYNIKVK